MKNIYILDEYISSQKNGIGTFLSQLVCSLDRSINNINIVSFNFDSEEFNIIVEEEKLTRVLFPPFKRGYFAGHSKTIEKFFKLYILDSKDNIFFLNHYPCSDLIKSLKNSHPLSLVIFIIHDLDWTSPLLGNLDEYVQQIKGSRGRNMGNSFFLKSYDMECEMYHYADRIICLSKDTYLLLTDIYKIDVDKISLIPNGLRDLLVNEKNIFPQEIRDRKRIGLNSKILLFIGRPTKQKGIFDLIEALRILLYNDRDIKLVVVGDGNEVSMKELIMASSDIASSIIYTGQLGENEVLEWLTISDIGVIPSYYEQCSYTAIEMMRNGLPIVASDGLGIRNMFIDDINAKIAKIGNRERPEEYQNNLKNAIARLLDSPELCKRLSINARQSYEDKYHIRYMKDKYQDLIEL